MKRKSSALVATSNGNGNGSAMGRPTSVQQLQRLYAFHAGRAEALRIVLELLDDGAAERRTVRGDSVIVEAVRLDEARRQALPPAKTAKRKRAWTKKDMKRQRKLTAKMLTKLSTSKPTERLLPQLGIMVHHGYIKKVAGGFVRTEKEFVP